MERATVTFAVVGHNEAATLATVTSHAMEAAGPGDRVCFVDSASTDGSGEIARRLGAEVVPAPLGKGRAMAKAITTCETSHICFLDADLVSSSANIPLALKQAAMQGEVEMLIADFVWPQKQFHGATTGVYHPLVSTLFPEALNRFGGMPLSGFRMLRSDLPLGTFPPGYGVETYLNVLATVRRLRTSVVPVGVYNGPVRRKPEIGRELAEVLLDMAVAHGRLDARLRPTWDAWVGDILNLMRTQPDPNGRLDDYPARLLGLASRSTPPRLWRDRHRHPTPAWEDSTPKSSVL